MTPPHAAVVGAGYSGTVQAIELVRAGARVTLVERAPRVARGVAYGTRHADHLLNVRAHAMSAFADDPLHFAGWLARDCGGDPDAFAPRRTYGRYIGELLESAKAEAGDRLRLLAGEVTDIVPAAGGERLLLADGGHIDADAAILSIGNLPPERARGISPEALPHGVYVQDPWTEDLAAGLGDSDTILLIGTGLTAVDAALMLDSAGFGGRILALSRRGLLPRAHAAAPHPPQRIEHELRPDCLDLLRSVRSRAASGDWRAAVDSLRPVTQRLWRQAAVAERRRFLRHLRPWWDVHRHRIAPAIAARIEDLRREGRLEVRAGKIVEASPADEGAVLRWRPRGSSEAETVRVRRIVNCTGPQTDISRAGEPLLDALLRSGRIRHDPCRIGIDVDNECRALDREGRACGTLFAIGPMTRGIFWEIVAVPDIRVQVRDLADRIAARRS